MSFKYPWEEGTVLGAAYVDGDAELAEERVKRLERGAANGWKGPSQLFLEDVSKYGRDAWIYLQLLKVLGATMLLASLFLAPLLAHAAQGEAIRQTDFAAVLARLSLANVDASNALQVGPVDLGFRGFPAFGMLAMLQALAIAGVLLWLRALRIPAVFAHPGLQVLSSAPYAVQVDGLPRHLAERLHHRYDLELIKHFETNLQEFTRDGSCFVCEVVLARDFGCALLAAQELAAARAVLRQMESVPDQGRPTSRWRGKQTSRLHARVESLAQQMEDSRLDDLDRDVSRAFVVLASEQDRVSVLRAFRFSQLPLVGRWLQPRALSFHGRSLVVTPAPEPVDITWFHLGVSARRRALWKLLTLGAVLSILLLSVGACFLVFWLLLGVRGPSAAQCGAGDWPSAWQEGSIDFCLAPPLQAVGSGAGEAGAQGEAGCDCLCADPGSWHSTEAECRQLGGTEATAAVLLCAAVTEAAHWGQSRAVPRLVRRLRAFKVSDEERATLAFLTLGQSLAPLSATLALLAAKAAMLFDRPEGVAQPLVWEVDRGWYLHAAPVMVIWCVARWLSPIVSYARRIRAGYNLQDDLGLPKRYASFLSVSIVSIMVQPLCPVFAPLAALGLLARAWLEGRALLRGDIVTPATSPTCAARPLVMVALGYLWFAVTVNATLSAWVFGHRGISGDAAAEGFPHASPGRFLAGAAIPATLMGALCVAAPTVALAGRKLLWLTGRWPRMPSGNPLTFQEAWLMMRHEGTLATYQMNDHPSFKSNTVLKDLQPQITFSDTGGIGSTNAPAGSASKLMNRTYQDRDRAASLANVLDKAPSRPVKAKK